MLPPHVGPAAARRMAQARSPAAGSRPVRQAAALAVPLIRGLGLLRTAGFCRADRRTTRTRQPMNTDQKYHLPSVSLSFPLVHLGHQK